MNYPKSNRAKIYLFFILLSTVAFIMRVFFLLPQFPMRFQIISFFTSFFFMTICYETIQFIHTQLNIYLPFQQNMPRRLFVQAFISLFFILGFTSMLLYFLLDYVPFEVNKFVRVAFYGVYIFATLFVNSLLIGSDLFSKWKTALLHSNELEKEKTKVQYDNLKNQLNPHFLFNSLTSLNSLIYKDPNLASDFLQQLSKVYRYVLQHKETNLVALREEIRFVSNYIELLKTRFGKGLSIHIKVSEEAASKLIIPVSLQIMIENAIKHNTTDEDQPLQIEIFDSEGYLIIRNSILAKRQVETSNKQGLENFKKLYSLFSEKAVEVLSEEKIFSVKIPLI